MKCSKRQRIFGLYGMLAMLLVLALSSLAAAEPQQDGEGYYLLATSADLAWFRDAVNEGDDFANWKPLLLKAKLTGDIDLEGTVWTPIAKNAAHDEFSPFNLDNAFWGVIDGAGHTISNFTIKAPAGDSFNVLGFVNALAGGTIKDLTIANAKMEYSNPAKKDILFAGILVGAVDGTLSNCSVQDSQATINISRKLYLGAVAGRAFGSKSPFSGCSAYGNILSGTSENPKMAGIEGSPIYVAVGGVAGGSFTTLQNCVSGQNQITAKNRGDFSQASAGGIIGHNYRAIDSCSAFENEITSIADQAQAGGIAGYSYGSIADSSAAGGAVVTQGENQGMAGGICGIFEDAVMSRCTVTGGLSIRAENSSTHAFAGGLAGALRDIAVVPPGAELLPSVSESVAADASVFGKYTGGVAGTKTSNATIHTNVYYSEKISAQAIGGGDRQNNGAQAYDPALATNLPVLTYAIEGAARLANVGDSTTLTLVSYPNPNGTATATKIDISRPGVVGLSNGTAKSIRATALSKGSALLSCTLDNQRTLVSGIVVGEKTNAGQNVTGPGGEDQSGGTQNSSGGGGCAGAAQFGGLLILLPLAVAAKRRCL